MPSPPRQSSPSPIPFGPAPSSGVASTDPIPKIPSSSRPTEPVLETITSPIKDDDTGALHDPSAYTTPSKPDNQEQSSEQEISPTTLDAVLTLSQSKTRARAANIIYKQLKKQQSSSGPDFTDTAIPAVGRVSAGGADPADVVVSAGGADLVVVVFAGGANPACTFISAGFSVTAGPSIASAPSSPIKDPAKGKAIATPSSPVTAPSDKELADQHAAILEAKRQELLEQELKQSLDAEHVYLDSLLAQRVAEEQEREIRASAAQIALNLTNEEWIGLVDQVRANPTLSAELLGLMSFVPIIDLLDSPPKATSLPLDPAIAEQAIPLRKSSRKKSMARRTTLPRPSQSEEDKDASIIWDDQDQWEIRSWRFYALPAIHVLEIEAVDILYMFVDKEYPILPATIQRMLNHGLEIDRDPSGNDLTTAIQLIQSLLNQLHPDAKVFRKILDICPRVQGEDFTKVPDDESTLTFLIDLGYKGSLYKENVDYPELIWEDFAFQIDNGQLKKGGRKIMPYLRGKGSQGKKTADTPQATVNVSEESDSEPARKRTSSRRVIKKKIFISVEDNIIPKPNTALELEKSMSLTEVSEEEAERIVTVSDLDPDKRRPSGIAFRDTSSVSKKMSPDPS
nr:hypothetical protein [Tanacetum cinerariifolium]